MTESEDRRESTRTSSLVIGGDYLSEHEMGGTRSYDPDEVHHRKRRQVIPAVSASLGSFFSPLASFNINILERCARGVGDSTSSAPETLVMNQDARRVEMMGLWQCRSANLTRSVSLFPSLT